MVQNAWLIPLFPLVAYLLLFVLGRRAQEGIVTAISVLAALAGFIVSLLILSDVHANGASAPYVFHWLTVGQNTLSMGFEVTPLNAMMLTVVTFISTLVLLFSKGYLHGDARYSVFYQYLNLFIFSMLGLVISPNLLQVYIFWELVGLCSFLLVGFWYFKPEAAAAAKKAFIVTRIGDVGLFIGIVLIYVATGTFEYSGVFEAFEAKKFAIDWITPDHFITLVAILMFIGAMGKSAQFPLHTWLPDAMEGPTPVSALIHAATMVAAGVYLVARAFPIFEASPDALTVIGIIGGITAIFAALIGLTQNDIKRVVAYSTVSQLGYMVMALGVSAYAASTFHLMTHAFFKALLFLAAGSVIHAIHHNQDIRFMGGLWKKLPLTGWTFLIGALALSGIPPFAGFWSKDEILLGALKSGNTTLFVLGLIAAFCTAFYIFRVFFMTFTGEFRGEKEVYEHAHESGSVMTIPLVLLSIMAIVAGLLNSPLTDHAFEHFIFGGGEEIGKVYDTEWWLAGLATVVALAGIGLSYLMYKSKSINPEALANGPLRPFYQLSLNKFYVDELYHVAIVKPVVWIGHILNFIDKWVVDGIVHLFGEGTYIGSLGLKYSQNGQVQTYGLVTLIGALLLIGAAMYAVGGVK
ncbi:NADH-quinone oxidoreductase subunit L [Tumebacillus permanentifrigoris]|uniref:NADH dehydrogenase subunit L n=1 Tax=Tumebacillus permanentifrigoris TaxID=378543 RepID=A0A316DDZ5_9BACL|nr:NADH-quinone oxidoreductase subunit L [Tumebacillus permanentifrigoris]PWK16254.1 NADH dehydrogenase subunit L [Tumebacillus permanentifrigoris]